MFWNKWNVKCINRKYNIIYFTKLQYLAEKLAIRFFSQKTNPKLKSKIETHLALEILLIKKRKIPLI